MVNYKTQLPNVSLSNQMDYLIAPLDFTEATSGILLERGFKMMNVEDFDAFQHFDLIRIISSKTLLDKYPDAESTLILRIFGLSGKEVFNAKLPTQNSRVDLPVLAIIPL